MPPQKKKGKPRKKSRPAIRKKSSVPSGRYADPNKKLAALQDRYKRLNVALQAAQMGTWELEFGSSLLTWSEVTYKLFGQARSTFKVTKRSFLNLVHPDDRSMVLKVLEYSVAHEEDLYAEYRVVLPDKTMLWFEMTGKVMRDRKKQPYKITGTIHDVTLKKSMEFEREEWKTRHELVSASAGLVIYDYDIITGNIVWSGNVEDVLQYKPAELGNINRWIELIHPHDREDALRILTEAQEKLHPYDVYYRFSRKSGGHCHMHDRGIFVAGPDGKAVRMLGMMSDVSARMEAEKTIKQSERSYRELFDTVGEAIFIQDAEGKFMDANRGACAMYGYNKRDFIGHTAEFLSASDKNDFRYLEERFTKALKGRAQTFEWWGRKKTGEVFLMEVRMTKGSYFGKEIIIATGFDITERREAEQALRESEQRFRVLHEASFGGIGLHDNGMIIDCNQGLCSLTGYTYDELIGMNGLDLIAPSWRPIVMEKIRTSYEKPYDVEGTRKDGSSYSLEIHAKNIPYKGKTIRVTEFRDITERKRAEEKILEQHARLLAITEDFKRKNEQLEEFTQIVSHNLRAPVGNILTLLNFLETASSADERAQYQALLKETTTNILYTLHELNEVLQIKQNKNIEKQELSFEKVFNHVQSMLKATIAEVDAEVITDFKAAPVIVYPKIYLESIILNLLSNALKYAHPERKPVISIRTYYSDSSIMLQIRDNGSGINLERYGHQIFKLHKTFHRHHESRGVGLFMIKNQIEAMGGEITISSLENEGTTFTVNFNINQEK